MIEFATLGSAAIEVLGQLFLCGPTWDGNIISKAGRTELVDAGLAQRRDGWNFLTANGVELAATSDVKARHDQRWYRKQQCL